MQIEKVFEFGGEGGSICIYRQINNSQEIFIYHHSEFDPTDEGLEISKNREYKTFNEPFQLIHDRYPWYLMYLEQVHDDFKDHVIARLIEKLNQKSIKPNQLQYSQSVK